MPEPDSHSAHLQSDGHPLASDCSHRPGEHTSSSRPMPSFSIGGAGDWVEEAPGVGPDAHQAFMHGLLAAYFEAPATETDLRVKRILAGLAEQTREVPVPGDQARSGGRETYPFSPDSSRPFRSWLIAAGLSATLVVSMTAVGLSFLDDSRTVARAEVIPWAPLDGMFLVSGSETWTECYAENIRIEPISTEAARISGRYFMGCRQNPEGEIDQLLLATDDRVLCFVYSGKPGRGVRKAFDVYVPLPRDSEGRSETIYLVRMATLSAADAIRCYEERREKGWRIPIWPLQGQTPFI